MAKRTVSRRVKDALRYRFFRQNWTIGVARCPIEALAGLCGAKAQREALQAMAWMPEERGLFRADPFPVPSGGDEGTIRILFEQLIWAEGRGTIDVCAFDGATFGPVEPVLRLPHHLSYPFTMAHEGRWLMLPEQAESGCVRACDPVSGQSEGAPLIEGARLIDSSIIEHDGRWWLFASHAGAAENVGLHLYHSESFGGPWTPVQADPVKSDIASARPAGHLFRYKGELYRPGQNCADYYGQSIKVHRVIRLDREGYEEEQVAEIAPLASSPYRDGLHTVSSCGPYTVIDAARLESTLHQALDPFASLVR